VVSAIFVPLFSLVYFFIDNIIESKALVPIFIIEKDWDPLSGDFNVVLHLQQYGG
jgi:hypothetical protein